jgi:hypothetical protein
MTSVRTGLLCVFHALRADTRRLPKSRQSYPIGWEPDDDGFRGHVFATPDNSTVVLSIKGTSGPWIGGGGPTTKKDKFNDNLLFSCCCAYVDWTWTVSGGSSLPCSLLISVARPCVIVRKVAGRLVSSTAGQNPI